MSLRDILFLYGNIKIYLKTEFLINKLFSTKMNEADELFLKNLNRFRDEPLTYQAKKRE